MRKLTPPTFAAGPVTQLCIESLQAGDLKTGLMLVAKAIEDAETEYLARGGDCSLFAIAEAPDIAGTLTVAQMERVYKGTFARSIRTRHIYNAIKKLPPNDICPLCGQRTVSTLDHYLAKSRHPALAVTPANLVPACADCNKLKLDAQPASAEEQTLHPYFDECDDAVWLVAEVQETVPAGLTFAPAPPDAWPALKRSRIRRHFEMFALGALYASHAGAELANIRYSLTLLAAAGGQMAVRQFLQDQAVSSRQVHRNSWRAASYQAWCASNWFCAGGFALT